MERHYYTEASTLTRLKLSTLLLPLGGPAADVNITSSCSVCWGAGSLLWAGRPLYLLRTGITYLKEDTEKKTIFPHLQKI